MPAEAGRAPLALAEAVRARSSAGLERWPPKPKVAGSNPAGRAYRRECQLAAEIRNALPGPVAQLAEQQTLNLLVEGSIPSGLTNSTSINSET